MEIEFFDEAFLAALPEDEDLAGMLLCNRYFEKIDGLNPHNQYVFSLKALGLLRGFCKAHLYQMEALDINKIAAARGKVRDQRKPIVESIKNSLLELQGIFDANILERELRQIGDFEHYFTFKFSETFEYTLEEGEVATMHQLIHELRELIEQTEQLDEHCGQRLLHRLERFRRELRPRMIAVDSFFLFFGELGHALEKFGGNIKPISDRAKAINQIMRNGKKMNFPAPDFAGDLLLPEN